MADMNDVAAAIAEDEHPVVIKILRKDEEPYVGQDGQPSTISVLGDESKAVRLARDAATRRFLRRGNKKPSPEELLESRIAQAAAGVVAWSGWESNGAPWECTAANVKTLLTADHILEQVEAGIRSHADFFARALPS
ncbi:MAG TPA: hypothetical protein DCQ64_04520 [Candidatus Rokubacteria bacterium]|nr:hypothetical protein [Candidatus Rokubacteria bacterium]